MTILRLALANLPFPESLRDAAQAAERAIAQAGAAGARIVCFPEAFVPGYRGLGKNVAPPDASGLDDAWRRVAAAARAAQIAVVLGTERIVDGGLRLSALVVDATGTALGFQDKVQLDPSEDATYAPGDGRRVFTTAGFTFGIAICHEGWRYPETVRWATRRGAQIVFHPHLHEAEPGGFRPTVFAARENTFHEKALLCRAAENTCYVASVNCASPGSPTTSAVVRPDGTLLAHQPYGEAGLLIVDVDLAAATLLLARRCREV